MLTKEQQQVWDRLAIPDPNNFFQQHRLKNENNWMTRQRKVIAIVAMETFHIQNCIALLEKNNQTNTKAYRGLTAELEKRS
jgi:hypothetical protein